MSAFGGMIQTTKGRNLQAKALTGVEIHFTRIAVGDGELNGSSISDLNALKHEVKSLDIKKLKTSGEQAIVGTVLSNQDVSTGFYWREIGLFAQDPDEGEILYCYGNAGATAEYIPAYGGPDVIEKTIDVVSIVGNAQNVSATINSLHIYATLEELKELGDSLTTVIATKETPEGAQTKADTAKTAAQAYTDSKVAELINSAPEALDTLKELADAMGGDSNLKENLINMIAGKASQVDFDAHKADNAYQTPTIVNTQIQLQRKSDAKRLFFYLDTVLSGSNITISLDAGVTSAILKDIDGNNITFLDKGYIEIVDGKSFFVLLPKGSLNNQDKQKLVDIVNMAQLNNDTIKMNMATIAELPSTANWNDILNELVSIKKCRSGTFTDMTTLETRAITNLPFQPSIVIVDYFYGGSNYPATGIKLRDGTYRLSDFSNARMESVTANGFTFRRCIDTGYPALTNIKWIAIK